MNKILLILFTSITLISAATSSIAMEEDQKQIRKGAINIHPKNWKNPEIVELLKKGRVVSLRPMREHLDSHGKKAEFDGDVFFVELDNGLKGVFKNLPNDDLGDGYAEVAAYQASVVLGFPHIPPTVMTSIKGMKGSLQLFVETEIDALDQGIYDAALKEASANDLANLKLFYFVFGQWDSGVHNILILKDQDKTHLIAIDNSGIRNHQYATYGSLPFVRVLFSEKLETNDWDKPFPFELAKTIENPTTEKLREVFGNSLPESFYQSFKSYSLSFRYVTYRDCLWRQYHAGHEGFEISFTNHLPEQTRKSLEALNLPVLKKIFVCAKGADFLTPSYLQAILERRDQVLRYFDKNASSRNLETPPEAQAEG